MKISQYTEGYEGFSAVELYPCFRFVLKYSTVQGTPSLYVLVAFFSTKKLFGVEDFLDDDNSRPYTYQKEKKSKTPNKHVSFKQRTIAYMEQFTLDVFISKHFVSASITHRVTCNQVAVTGGHISPDRAREADVYTTSYTPRERDKFEVKIRAVVQSLIDNGVDVKIYLD
ncbi:hypothetical protein DH2020_019368 [Rehmannia glutinosa]|uniref:Uncharacterized protein n=1 Tax=Rehmannia glutinosa TaxID=99300 RepID=A0ABR0WPA1_REHGL